MRYSRNLLPLAFCASIGVAHGQISVSNINAAYTLNPGALTRNWNDFIDGSAMTVDFTQNAPPFRVGASTGFSSGSSSITFDVLASGPISSVDIVLQGNVELFGRVLYSETATAGGNSLGTASGSVLGSSYTAGVDGGYTRVFSIAFSQAVTSFSISQTLTENIGDQGLPSASEASVGLSEQTFGAAVPEPASIGCLGLGVIALIRRRRAR